MTQTVWQNATHSLKTHVKCNVAEFPQMGNEGETEIAKLKRFEELSTCAGLMYLAPLVVSRAICIYRCFRSAVPEKLRSKFVLTPLRTLPRGWNVKSIAVLEFRLGPYLFSLNRP